MPSNNRRRGSNRGNGRANGRRRRRNGRNTAANGGFANGAVGNQSSGASAYNGVSESIQDAGMSIRSMPLFGQRTRRVVQYATQFISVTGNLSAGAYVFAANGLFDPDITSTGHQPMGFDQMMIFFNHYTVTRSRIQVQFASTTAAQPCVALAVSGSSTPLTAPSQIMEVGRVGLTWLTGSGVANSHGVLRASCNIGKFQGVINTVDNPDLSGDSASNPAELVYYIVYLWNPIDNTSASASIQALIEFDVLFHEPRSPTQS